MSFGNLVKSFVVYTFWALNFDNTPAGKKGKVADENVGFSGPSALLRASFFNLPTKGPHIVGVEI